MVVDRGGACSGGCNTTNSCGVWWFLTVGDEARRAVEQAGMTYGHGWRGCAGRRVDGGRGAYEPRWRIPGG